MKTLAVFNSKGGVGKSTITAELCAYIEHYLKGKSAICIDTDINGSLLDFSFEREKQSLPFPEVIGHVQNNIDRKIESFKNSGKYDYCIVDCHGDYDRLDQNLMYVADMVLIPVIPDDKNIKPTLKVYEEVLQPIIAERGGLPFPMIALNNIRKNFGPIEREIVKTLESDEITAELCPVKLYKHDACFRDVWREGVTAIDTVFYEIANVSREKAGTNVKLFMKHIFKNLDELS